MDDFITTFISCVGYINPLFLIEFGLHEINTINAVCNLFGITYDTIIACLGRDNLILLHIGFTNKQSNILISFIKNGASAIPLPEIEI
jgi:hypothetical protein